MAKNKMLTQVLIELKASGVVGRKVYEITPPKVEYILTKEKKKLVPVMNHMATWRKKFEV